MEMAEIKVVTGRRMRRTELSVLLPVVLVTTLLVSPMTARACGSKPQPGGRAQDDSRAADEGGPGREDPAAATEETAAANPPAVLDAWTHAWTPGKAHTRLAARAGFWKLTTRTWGDPSEEPVVTETMAVRKSVLGGRALQEEVVGEVQGLDFQSLGYLGYDNVTRRWWSLWMDTLSTAPVFTAGTADPNATVVVLTGEYADPLTGKSRSVRTVIRFVDYDTERFEWWETRAGREVKTMDVLYQRQGPFQRPGPLVDPER